MEHAAKVLNERYGREIVKISIEDSYYNMAEKIAPHMELVENAMKAAKLAGMEPFTEAVRGGTDGCRLSFMGLPTPNLCTGGFAYHGRFEHIAAVPLRFYHRFGEKRLSRLHFLSGGVYRRSQARGYRHRLSAFAAVHMHV